MALGLLLCGLIYSKQIARQFQTPPETQISFARIPAFGFDRLKADLLWISFVLYIGDSEQRAKTGLVEAPSRLSSIIDADPTLMPPYWFAAFTLGGDLKKPSAAATILDRGIQANPDNWYLYYIAGFNQYLWAHDEVRASKYYAKAATLPGAPDWMMRQAQILRAQIPSTLKRINVLESILETGRGGVDLSKVKAELIKLYTHVLQTTPNQKQKDAMAERLRELQVSK